MNLQNAQVFKYKSIDDSTDVKINEKITVLVGKNESGKTAFLEALHKSNSIDNKEFDPVYDYPKREYSRYRNQHDAGKFTDVVRLTYKLSEYLIARINNEVFNSTKILPNDFVFSRTTNYGNKNTITITLDNQKILSVFRKELEGLEKTEEVFTSALRIDDVVKKILDLGLPEDSKLAVFAKDWTEKTSKKTNGWGMIDWYIWSKYISPSIPEFLYFDDYKLLPGKINLPNLLQRKASAKLTDGDETTLGLLSLAGITLEELMNEEGYEKSKAKLEAISLTITEEIFNYWKQNQDLSVEFDVRDDVKDVAPFNNGKNLYIRIKNNRHGVTVPFDQRSKGFIWFFSFITWFSSVKERLDTNDDLILLLDEPGLSLHAMAQADFLNYIDTLSNSHQIIYTTHSPFMIKNGDLGNVRVVEDKIGIGTRVTDQLEGSGDDSLFPLQAALGYSIAQNLFISSKNILVEGPADMILLQHISTLLENTGKHGIESGIIVPVGGLDKLVTFVALLGANKLQLVVIHDRASVQPQKLEDLMKNKIIERKRVFDYSIFREPNNLETDIEDLLPISLYLTCFNQVYKKELGDKQIVESDLDQHPRIVERINKWLVKNTVVILKDGGYNHYRVAQQVIVSLNETNIPKECSTQFERLFIKVNDILK